MRLVRTASRDHRARYIPRSIRRSVERAAAAVKARTLIVVAEEDHMVNPGPALMFAQLLHAPTVRAAGECGHLAISCQKDMLYAAIAVLDE